MRDRRAKSIHDFEGLIKALGEPANAACPPLPRHALDRSRRHREAALAAVAIQSEIDHLILDCFAEFTPDHDPGLAMTVDPN